MTTSLTPTRRTVLAGSAAILAAPATVRADERDVLRVASPWEWTSDEPSDTGYLMTRLQIAETLVMVEPDGRLVGGLAERWSVDEDRLTWRFTIRAGVVFHDGSALTPDAVLRSLTRAMMAESLQQVPLEDMRVEGSDLVVRTRTPFGHLPAVLVDAVSVILAPAAFGPDGRVARVIGTGPLRIARQDGRTTVELERFDRYWGSAVRFPRVRYTAISNGDTRTNVAVAGDADILFTTLPTASRRIDAAGEMRVESLTVPRVRIVAFNCGLPQFADVRVRRALSLALDRRGIATAVLRHPPSAASQLLPPVAGDWHDPTLTPYAHDVAGANALLDQAGFVRGADGIRTKDGVRLAATMLTIASRPELTVMGTAMQAQLRTVGMELAVEPGPSAAVPAAVQAGTLQMSLFARTYVNVPDVIATMIPDFTRERSTWGAMAWPGRDRMRALTDAYVEHFDAAAKADVRRSILRLLHDEMPVTAVSWFEHTVAVNKRIRGLAIDPFEMRYMLHTARRA